MQEFNKVDLPEVLRHEVVDFGLVLGSGLGSLVEGFADLVELDYSEVVGLPESRVAGHSGKFVLGSLAGKRILAASGRVHLYEGYSAREVGAFVRLIAAVGCKRLILTNAAGTLRLQNRPGRWLMLKDQLNLTGTSPLEGSANFLDLSEIYSSPWREQFAEVADELGIELHEGVYAGLRGPQYETPAEVQMLGRMGADAVGMSTVLEAIQAKALGLEVVGFSCLTNWAAGLADGGLNHQEVLQTGLSAADDFIRLLSHYLERLP